jgi:hypothetical protein
MLHDLVPSSPDDGPSSPDADIVIETGSAVHEYAGTLNLRHFPPSAKYQLTEPSRVGSLKIRIVRVEVYAILALHLRSFAGVGPTIPWTIRSMAASHHKRRR